MPDKKKWKVVGFRRDQGTGRVYLTINRQLPNGQLDSIELTEDDLLAITVDAATKLQDIRIWPGGSEPQPYVNVDA